MKVEPYSVKSVWRGVLEDIPRRRASFFMSGPMAPLIFWLMVAMAAKFESQLLVRTLIPVLLGLVLGLASVLTLRTARRRRYRHACSQRIAALVNNMYYGVMLLSLSSYSLLLAVEYGTRYTTLPFLLYPALMALYGLSAVAAGIWAPSSLPRSVEDDAQAASRGVRWLPWVMGFQGSLIGLGVFLGAWFLHGDVSWGNLLFVGLFTLCAVLFLVVSILGLYRFLVLALLPIPEEVRQEFGIRD